jgi:hypothetical protein
MKLARQSPITYWFRLCAPESESAVQAQARNRGDGQHHFPSKVIEQGGDYLLTAIRKILVRVGSSQGA